MAARMPAVPVSVAKAVQESVPTEIRVVGNGEASSVVQVKSQIAGELISVNFAEGQNVSKGELLFRIDPRPYEDALHQAEAMVERDRAQIAQAQASVERDNAQVKFADSESKRQSELIQGGLTPRSTLDQAQSTAEAARATASATKATVDTAQAALRADEAAVSAAKLNLNYCDIHAPISGRTGNLLVHAGNLVKVNDVPLVVINQISPIFVNFNVPEQHLGAIRRLNAGHPLTVRVFAQDQPNRIATGHLATIDNTVDATTGTIHLKATFENADGMLWPGEFVTVILTLDTIQNAIVIPTEAVQSGQQGTFVYTVKADNKVEMRPVTVSPSQGNRTVVQSGVAPGDTVVTDGQLRLFPGAEVKPVDAPKAGTSQP
ncbi:MAG TPA: efflux RND transporter periplasmic adaptor subunit [Candidatus Sulfopaludibacter sp.]|jgi:multidrug efflux system membrane fusion protein|nr:efflux RND transporter periplasmic adaptor subunit [Candidatus Sulfopaludibacter sp.]